MRISFTLIWVRQELLIIISGKIRAPVSTISHKAFACAKIRIAKENEVTKGKKNLVQSMRYLMIGLQVNPISLLLT